MIRFLIFGTVTAVAVGFIFYQLLEFGLFMKSGRGRTEEDIQELKRRLLDLYDVLVPFNQKELELLSLQQSNKDVDRGVHTTTVGTYDSIYHEPLLAYAYKSYPGGSKGVMVAMTTEDTWVYDIKGHITTIFLNDVKVGVVSSDGKLRGAETNRDLAYIDVTHSKETHPVFVGDKEIGYVQNPALASDVNPRAFQIFNQLEQDEQDLFLSLTILSLVEESL